MSGALAGPGGRQGERFAFGEFTLDLGDGFLRRGVADVKLRPKAFEVLAYLVQRSGKLVTKNELVATCWAGLIVTDNSLAQCMVEIRRALDDERQEKIRTIARRGYVFALPVIALRAAEDTEPAAQPLAPASNRRPRRTAAAGALTAALVAGTATVVWWLDAPPARLDLEYTQLTDFTDSAVAPALSRDGRMIAFIRGDRYFHSFDQIWLKRLPNGEPVQLTDSAQPKFAPVFTPDGSRVLYSIVDGDQWDTHAVSVHGGPSQRWLPNASGLSWLNDDEVIFSAKRPNSMHMGIVTATPADGARRDVYWPAENAMAHYSYGAPGGRSALIAEMDPRGVWLPCRLVPLAGGGTSRVVGPQGQCTSAGWSPDGRWMFFGADVGGDRQIWRQRYPDGRPEQLTFGPTEATGIAIDADGRSLVTSIGLVRSELWIRDARGERALSTEGIVASISTAMVMNVNWNMSSVPSFSPDGRYIYYLLRRQPIDDGYRLWRVDLGTDAHEEVLPGIAVAGYDLSPDGTEVVFSTGPDSEHTEIWLAHVDVATPLRKLAEGNVGSPLFGPNDTVIYGAIQGDVEHVFSMSRDGGSRTRVTPYPVNSLQGASPDGSWLVANLFAGGTWAVPASGGTPMRLCRTSCHVRWSPDGKAMYLVLERASRGDPGTTLALQLPDDGGLPAFPDEGLTAAAAIDWFPEARLMRIAEIVPGRDSSIYAYVRTTAHRNLFRIVLQ